MGVCIFYCNCCVDCYGKLFSLIFNERRLEYKQMKSISTVRSGKLYYNKITIYEVHVYTMKTDNKLTVRLPA